MLHRPSRIGLPMKGRRGWRWFGQQGPAGLRWLSAFALAVASLTVFSPSALADPGELERSAADRVLASADIPDPIRKVGEVRLLARGDAVVVQTLLSTKLLGRAIAEIRRKEAANWPDDPTSTQTYVAALEEVHRLLDDRAPDSPWSDRRRRLLIEFAADATDHAVFVGTFGRSNDVEDAKDAKEAKDADDGEGGERGQEGEGVDNADDSAIRGREVLRKPELGRPYVLRNVRLILADAFDLPETDVDRLGSLGPAAPRPPRSSDQEEPVVSPGGTP